MSFVQFDEGEPENDALPAELRRTRVEATELLDGSTVVAERIEPVVAGRPTNTHWCIGGLVVKSDWDGAQSFLVGDVDAACAGLDWEVAAHIREFAARPHWS